MAVDGILRIMSYNIHHCDPPSVTGDTPLTDTTAAVIARQNPDIVAMQEVDMNTNRSGNVNQSKVIAQKLGMNYFFAPAKAITGGTYGVAILSKFPMSEATIHVLPFPDTSGETRVLATVKITFPDGSAIRFGCTHFDLVTENKKAEVAKVVEIAAAEPLPFIIAGDLNSWENSGIIATLDTKFTRTCNGCPLTSPAKNPQNTIDYIAFRHPENKFSVMSHKAVNETFASDHRPIVAEIAYQKSSVINVSEPNGILSEDFSSPEWENELTRLNPSYVTPPATGTNSFSTLNGTDLYFNKYRLIGAIESLGVLPCASGADITHNNDGVAVGFRLKNDATGQMEFSEIPTAGTITIHARNGNADNITTFALEKFINDNWTIVKSFSLTPNGAMQSVRDEIFSYNINSTSPVKLRLRNTGTRYINLYRVSIGAYGETSGIITPAIIPLKIDGRHLTSTQPTNIYLYNLPGVLLFQQENNTSFYIPASIRKGIYIVKSTYGSQKIIVQ